MSNPCRRCEGEQSRCHACLIAICEGIIVSQREMLRRLQILHENAQPDPNQIDILDVLEDRA